MPLKFRFESNLRLCPFFQLCTAPNGKAAALPVCPIGAELLLNTAQLGDAASHRPDTFGRAFQQILIPRNLALNPHQFIPAKYLQVIDRVNQFLFLGLQMRHAIQITFGKRVALKLQDVFQ